MNEGISYCVMCSKELIDGRTTRWNKFIEPVCDCCFDASEVKE